ncbi:MAG: protoglobin domain-containing protein [Polyangiaceae bacterium]
MERRRALLDELRSYVGLTPGDERLLATFCVTAEPSFPAIADEFYAVIRMHPGAFAVFGDEAQAQRLHATLQGWLGELLGGSYDEAYVEKHARIGQVHVRVGLELRYMITAMSHVRAALQRIAADTLVGDPSVSAATSTAIARICDVDLAIMLESYKDDLVGRVERARVKEQVSMRSQLAIAAGLAHEIRNPLNSASLHLSVLERGLARSADAPAPMREAAEVLRAEIWRLSGLVTDFLEVSRPRPLVLAECDLNAVATSVHTLLAPEAESRGVTLALEPCPTPVAARVDVERTEQVLVNLVRNALEAVEDGGAVSIRVRRLAEHVEIDVTDDGAGVPDPNAPIFDAFYTTKQGGTGLGLSIVQRIVTEHGGAVSFSSQPGSTVFTVRLPAEPA